MSIKFNKAQKEAFKVWLAWRDWVKARGEKELDEIDEMFFKQLEKTLNVEEKLK